MSGGRQIGAEDRRSMAALAADHSWQTSQPLCSQWWWQRRPSHLKRGRRCNIYTSFAAWFCFADSPRVLLTTSVWAGKAGPAELPAFQLCIPWPLAQQGLLLSKLALVQLGTGDVALALGWGASSVLGASDAEYRASLHVQCSLSILWKRRRLVTQLADRVSGGAPGAGAAKTRRPPSTLHTHRALLAHSATSGAPPCSLCSPATPQVPVGRAAVSYEEQATRRKRHAAPTTPPSTLPSTDEADALLDLDRDLFTDDAWQGMQRCWPFLSFSFFLYNARQGMQGYSVALHAPPVAQMIKSGRLWPHVAHRLACLGAQQKMSNKAHS